MRVPAARMATPLVLGEQVEAPRYGDDWTEAASRKFYAAYKEYQRRIAVANAGQVRHQVVSVRQLIPSYIRICFERAYNGRVEFDDVGLMTAVQKHAGYTTTGGAHERGQASAQLRKVVTMQRSGGSVKDRAMKAGSSLERYFSENLTVQALFRASNGDWLPGPAESVSSALVDGIWPPPFRQYVRSELTYKDGWKKNPDIVLDTMFAAAEQWKFIEAHGSDSDKRVDSRQGKGKAQSSTGECYNCQEKGHYANKCPHPRKQGGGRGGAGEG